MELIKKIKQAEADAQDIIDQAKARAVQRAEESRKGRLAAQAEAEQERKKAIEGAVAAARSQGRAEAANLKAEAETERQKLRQQTEGKMPAAVETVMNYLKG